MSCSGVSTQKTNNLPEAAREYRGSAGAETRSGARAFAPGNRARGRKETRSAAAAQFRARRRKAQRCGGCAASCAGAAEYGTSDKRGDSRREERLRRRAVIRFCGDGGGDASTAASYRAPRKRPRSASSISPPNPGSRFRTPSAAKEKKDSILESTGTGAAIFDFDGDGANDIFIANGPPSRSRALQKRRRRTFHRGRPTGRI